MVLEESEKINTLHSKCLEFPFSFTYWSKPTVTVLVAENLTQMVFSLQVRGLTGKIHGQGSGDLGV